MNRGELVECYAMSYKGIGIIVRKVSELDPNDYYLVAVPGRGVVYVPLHAMEKAV